MVMKRIYGPTAAPTSPTTLYTVPAGVSATLRHIHIQNPGGGSSRTITMSIGADAAGTRILDTYAIAAGSYLSLYGPFILAAGEVLQATASNAALVITIAGELTAV